MKDLMIHVEKIVRPIRAMQFRKLRMRRELLAHLTLALDEEQAHGVDPAAAMETAKQRLGKPEDLRHELQRTVPWIERVLLGRVPAPKPLERWEARSLWIWGLKQPLAMAHMAILTFVAFAVSYAALVISVTVMPPREILAARFEFPASVVTLDFIAMVSYLTFFFACGRLIIAAMSQLRAIRIARIGAIVIGSPLAIVIATVTLAGRRAPAPTELARGFVLGLATFAIMILVGRLLRRLDRPYSEWLTLELAG